MLLTAQVRLRLRQALQTRIDDLDDDQLVAACIMAGYSFSDIQDFVREFSPRD